MEDPHIVVQVIFVFTSASNPNSSYGVKIWGYIDFGQGWKTPEYYTFALLLNSIINFVGEPMNIAFVTHALIFVLWISMEMFALTDDVVKNFL